MENINTKKILQAGVELSDLVLNSSLDDDGLTTFVRDYLDMLMNGTGTFGKQNQAIKDFENESNKAMEEMSELAETNLQSSQKVQEMTEAFTNLENELNELKQSRVRLDKITELLTSSLKSIQMQLRSIQDISTQTHLLSINASIEAARAGKAGAGFRIIANEVNKLSDSTDSNTKNIEEIIEDFSERLNTLVQENQSSTTVLERLRNTTIQSKNLLTEIGEQNNTTAELTNRSVQTIGMNNRQLINVSKAVEEENINKIKQIADIVIMNSFDLNERVSLMLEIRTIFNNLLKNE